MLSKIIDRPADETAFKPSPGMVAARTKIEVLRKSRDEARDAERRAAEAFNTPGAVVALSTVHEAEAAAEAAEARLADARREYAQKRSEFGERFLSRLAPIGDDLRADLADIASALEKAIAPARAADAFATSTGLPVSHIVGASTRLAGIAAELRKLSNPVGAS
jgi:hypothetical protein